MTQRHILTKTQAAFVGLEPSFGTPPASPRRLFLRGDANPLATLTRDHLARADASVYQHANQSDILGLKSGSVKLSFDAKHLIDPLVAAATPPAAADAGALSHQVVLHHCFGTSHVAAGGVIHATTPATTTVLTLATGQGARFMEGTVCFPHINGADVPRIVRAVTGDAITVWPPLPSAPAAGQLVLNSFSFARAEAHDSTLGIATLHTQQGAPETQRVAYGVTGQIAWTAEVRKNPMWAFDGALTGWDDGGDLSLPDDDASDDMGPAFVWDPQLFLFDNVLGAALAAAPTAVNAVKTMVAVPNTFTSVVSGAAVEGVVAKVMTGGRDAPATFEVVTRFDRAYELAYEAETRFSAMLYGATGSGNARRRCVWFFPNLSFTAKPDRTNDGGLVYSALKFKALPNTIVAGSPLGASSTDFMRSPVVYAQG
jgi:hypothetical protein